MIEELEKLLKLCELSKYKENQLKEKDLEWAIKLGPNFLISHSGQKQTLLFAYKLLTVEDPSLYLTALSFSAYNRTLKIGSIVCTLSTTDCVVYYEASISAELIKDSDSFIRVTNRMAEELEYLDEIIKFSSKYLNPSKDNSFNQAQSALSEWLKEFEQNQKRDEDKDNQG